LMEPARSRTEEPTSLSFSPAVFAALFARSARPLASVLLSREKLASEAPVLPVLAAPKLEGEFALPAEPVLPPNPPDVDSPVLLLPKVSFALRSISVSAV